MLVLALPSAFSHRGLWKVVVLAALCGIWLERNIRVFEDREEDELVLWEKIIFWFSLWVYRDKEFGEAGFLEFYQELAPFL